MQANPVILSYVTIREKKISLDDNMMFERKELSSDNFLLAAYEQFEINYPKFFKMDMLCKTGFLATELLLKNRNVLAENKPEDIGIIVSNANSSLDTDLKFEKSLMAAPSPSLFVYTLPNVLIGEVCIRHGIKGESACFVFDIFDSAFQSNYVNSLLETNSIKLCVSGWADFYNDKAEAFFYLAAQSTSGESIHNTENLDLIWNNRSSLNKPTSTQ